MASEKITIESEWKKYVGQSYPNVVEGSTQYEVMKNVFFCAWFSSLNVISIISCDEDLSDVQTVVCVERLREEAVVFIRKEIKRGLERMRKSDSTSGN